MRTKVRPQYTKRVRIDDSGPTFAARGPRAEGGRGEVNLPPIRGLTSRGSADFMLNSLRSALARRPICTQRSFSAAQLTRSAISLQRSFYYP